jgi:hypothetical protein
MNLIALQDIVDRGQETERFKDFLNLRTERRIFAVSDDSGWGKSTLLRKLRHVCERDGVPVALIYLNELADLSEFTLTREMVDQLHQAGVPFPSFQQLNFARAFRDMYRFSDTYHSLKGTIHADGASIHGGQVAGLMFNIQHADKVEARPWSEEAEKEARLLCLDAFLVDLFAEARKRKVVIIADAVEYADEGLQRWLLRNLIARQVIGRSDHRLVVVLSGENLDGLLQPYFDESGAQFEFIDALCSRGSWCLSDTERMLQVHKLTGLDATVVQDIHKWISTRKVSLADALLIAAIAKRTAAAQ